MLEIVFPAHAGMSPTWVSCSLFLPSFPRPRGDEPQCKYQAIMRQQFSPPTRG